MQDWKTTQTPAERFTMTFSRPAPHFKVRHNVITLRYGLFISQKLTAVHRDSSHRLTRQEPYSLVKSTSSLPFSAPRARQSRSRARHEDRLARRGRRACCRAAPPRYPRDDVLRLLP